jgi:hypothetical protein
MKMNKLIVFATIVSAVAVVTEATASPFGFFDVSGTIMTQTNYTSEWGVEVGKILKARFNTKTVLALLADATQVGWFTNEGSALAYDPNAYNDEATAWYSTEHYYEVHGIFYVTNTITHDAYRLDGNDGANNYYSYIEFDCVPWLQGFWHSTPLGTNSVQKYKSNFNTSKLSAGTVIQHALLYIHSNPYAFDIPGHPDAVFDNDNALIIRGLGKFDWTYKSPRRTMDIKVTGSGDGYFSGMDDPQVVVDGKFRFKGDGPTREIR